MDYLVHFHLSDGELVSAEVQAGTREEVIAGIERARQSPTILLRGIGTHKNKVRVVASADVTNYQVRDRDRNIPVHYALDLPA